MADEKVFSQADIDVDVDESTSVPADTASSVTDVESPKNQAAPASESKTAQKVQTVSVGTAKSAPARSSSHEVPRAVSPDDVESMHAILIDLAKRVAKLEAAIVKSQQIERTIAEAKATMANQPPQDFQTVVSQLQELCARVDGISEKLQSTAGYDIGKIFRCNSCDSQGTVAMRVKCTDCGRENWWGWWPKKSS